MPPQKLLDDLVGNIATSFVADSKLPEASFKAIVTKSRDLFVLVLPQLLPPLQSSVVDVTSDVLLIQPFSPRGREVDGLRDKKNPLPPLSELLVTLPVVAVVPKESSLDPPA